MLRRLQQGCFLPWPRTIFVKCSSYSGEMQFVSYVSDALLEAAFMVFGNFNFARTIEQRLLNDSQLGDGPAASFLVNLSVSLHQDGMHRFAARPVRLHPSRCLLVVRHSDMSSFSLQKGTSRRREVGEEFNDVS